MPSGVDILCCIPDIANIGRSKLQEYADEWIHRPIARQFAVTHLIVDSDLMVTVNIDDKRAQWQDDRPIVPIDQFVGYIIDQHFTDATQRNELHAHFRKLSRIWNQPDNKFDVLSGRVGRLWLKCKNPTCDASLETSQEVVEGQVIQCPPSAVTCPVCGHTDMYDGNDFHLRFAKQ
jgi:hypothetical protein